jgi:hypothetical protein
MITLGIVDLLLILMLILAVVLAYKRRATALTLLVAVVLIVVLAERLAPGTMASVGNAIHGIDRVNDQGPHLAIQPIIRLEK